MSLDPERRPKTKMWSDLCQFMLSPKGIINPVCKQVELRKEEGGESMDTRRGGSTERASSGQGQSGTRRVSEASCTFHL